jgi:hypothetical protein
MKKEFDFLPLSGLKTCGVALELIKILLSSQIKMKENRTTLFHSFKQENS